MKNFEFKTEINLSPQLEVPGDLYCAVIYGYDYKINEWTPLDQEWFHTIIDAAKYSETWYYTYAREFNYNDYIEFGGNLGGYYKTISKLYEKISY